MNEDSPRILRLPRRDQARREHYIPLRPSELVERLIEEPQLTDLERDSLRTLADLLRAILHRDHHERLQQLKQDYAPFDPDAQTGKPKAKRPAETEAGIERVFAGVDHLLERANFKRLTEEELQATLAASSAWGMSVAVHLGIFRRLTIYVRGDAVGEWDVHSWFSGRKIDVKQVPVYERLALVFCLKDDVPLPAGMQASGITLKLFKNIPQMDVEILLPGTQARMSWMDALKLALPTASGLGLAIFKIIKGAVVLAFASFYSTLVLLGFIGGTLGYGVRSFFGYLNLKERYQHHLTKRLYFQNLDNNSGVLFRLLDEAEEQDFREAFLAWYMLWQMGSRTGWSLEQIDEVAEERLRRWLGFDIDFEVIDALDKLERLGLAECIGSRWRAVSLPIALLRLERCWRETSPLEAQWQARKAA